MNDDDLLRRLEKLVRLKEHPSTLPAIREAATRAEERLRATMPRNNNPVTPGYYRRGDLRPNPAFERFLRELDRATQQVKFPWMGIVGIDRDE